MLKLRGMKKWFVIASAGVGLALTGCSSSHPNAQADAERLRLKNEAQSARTEAELYKTQLDVVSQEAQAKDGQINELSEKNDELQKELDELNQKYADAINNPTPLPKAVATELAALADAQPELLEFDGSRGMIKFKSDVTFAPGSADLTPKAKEVIVKLAAILNGKEVDSFELMVAGHTDSVKVGKFETLKKGHLDNWYLSSHRAIAVGKCLQGSQVSPNRLAMVGYADQKPLASNATEDGRAKNRRVELLILPTHPVQVDATWMKAGKGPSTRPIAHAGKGMKATARVDVNK